MGEIKFRALDNKLKRLFSDVRSIGFENGEICCFIGESDNEEDTKSEYIYLNNAILQQYTELKDKNGKEIYEGDIVRFSEHYCGDSTIEEQVKVIKWDINGYTDDLLVGSYNAPNWCEVIGNIYQNPELLKE